MPLESLEHLSQEEIFDGWKFPPKMPVLARHSWCAQANKNYGSYLHRRFLIESFWPEPDFVFHDWTARRLRGVDNNSFVTWVGSASSGKTVDAAVLALEWWLESPHDTAVICCSTTAKLLRKRIWSGVSHYHRLLAANLVNGKVRHAPKIKTDAQLDGMIGQLIDSDTMIRWRPGDTKNGIFGLAVAEGPVEEAVNSLIGIKARRMWLIIDEMQGVPEAVLDACNNLVSNPIFRFLGMGNPVSRLNLLVRASEPKDGWDSVRRGETEEWPTLGGPTEGDGLCQQFFGPKSPACLNPEFEKKCPWMINRRVIAGILKGCKNNTKDPRYQAMAEGWPPDSGVDNTVLEDATVKTFRIQDQAIWTAGYKRCAGLDPSFEGTDRKVLTIGRFGKTTNADEFGNRWIIQVDEVIDVPVDTESDVELHHQIARFCKEQCVKRGILPTYFALDSTGEGGGLASILRMEWGDVISVEFGGSPSDEPLNDGTEDTAKDRYDRKATEIILAIRSWAMSHGLRGVTDQAVKECCQRKTFMKGKKLAVQAKGKLTIDGKQEKGYKQIHGHSPDESESLALMIAACQAHGAYPAIVDAPIPETKEETIEDPYAPQPVDEYSEESYAMSDQW